MRYAKPWPFIEEVTVTVSESPNSLLVTVFPDFTLKATIEPSMSNDDFLLKSSSDLSRYTEFLSPKKTSSNWSGGGTYASQLARELDSECKVTQGQRASQSSIKFDQKEISVSRFKIPLEKKRDLKEKLKSRGFVQKEAVDDASDEPVQVIILPDVEGCLLNVPVLRDVFVIYQKHGIISATTTFEKCDYLPFAPNPQIRAEVLKVLLANNEWFLNSWVKNIKKLQAKKVTLGLGTSRIDVISNYKNQVISIIWLMEALFEYIQKNLSSEGIEVELCKFSPADHERNLQPGTTWQAMKDFDSRYEQLKPGDRGYQDSQAFERSNGKDKPLQMADDLKFFQMFEMLHYTCEDGYRRVAMQIDDRSDILDFNASFMRDCMIYRPATIWQIQYNGDISQLQVRYFDISGDKDLKPHETFKQLSKAMRDFAKPLRLCDDRMDGNTILSHNFVPVESFKIIEPWHQAFLRIIVKLEKHLGKGGDEGVRKAITHALDFFNHILYSLHLKGKLCWVELCEAILNFNNHKYPSIADFLQLKVVKTAAFDEAKENKEVKEVKRSPLEKKDSPRDGSSSPGVETLRPVRVWAQRMDAAFAGSELKLVSAMDCRSMLIEMVVDLDFLGKKLADLDLELDTIRLMSAGDGSVLKTLRGLVERCKPSSFYPVAFFKPLDPSVKLFFDLITEIKDFSENSLQGSDFFRKLSSTWADYLAQQDRDYGDEIAKRLAQLMPTGAPVCD